MFGKIREIEEIGFWISREVVAYMMLAYDKEHGLVSDEIREIMDDGLFACRAKAGFLPDRYSDGFAFLRLYEDDNSVYCATPFAGTVKTLFPEMAASPVLRYIGPKDDGVFFIPASRKADMFIPAYSSPDELLDEFKSVLARFAVVLPDDFDWYAHIVRIDGTEFYDDED